MQCYSGTTKKSCQAIKRTAKPCHSASQQIQKDACAVQTKKADSLLSGNLPFIVFVRLSIIVISYQTGSAHVDNTLVYRRYECDCYCIVFHWEWTYYLIFYCNTSTISVTISRYFFDFCGYNITF